MSKQQKTQEIEHLNQKFLTLKDQLEKISIEAREWAKKRDKLNGQLRDLRLEILQSRNERDMLNEKVKELKERREKAKTELHSKIEEIEKIDREIELVTRKRPSRSLKTLQEELENVEWKIQTSSLDLGEEKELVERVRQLETQLRIHKKIGQLNQKILELKTEAKASQINAKHCHEELTENVQKSQQIHAKMLEKIAESKKLKAEADNLHNLFVETKKKGSF